MEREIFPLLMYPKHLEQCLTINKYLRTEMINSHSIHLSFLSIKCIAKYLRNYKTYTQVVITDINLHVFNFISEKI